MPRPPSVEVRINGKRVGVVGFRAEGICQVGTQGNGALVGYVIEVPRSGPDMQRTWRFGKVKRTDEVVLRLTRLPPSRPDHEAVDTAGRQLRTGRALLERETRRRAEQRRQYLRLLRLPARRPPKPARPETPTRSTHVWVDGHLRCVSAAAEPAHVSLGLVLSPAFRGAPRIDLSVSARVGGIHSYWLHDAPLAQRATVRVVTTAAEEGTPVVKRFGPWPKPRTHAQLRVALKRLESAQTQHEENVRWLAGRARAERAAR